MSEIRSEDITDPRLRRLRKALRRAEVFLSRAPKSKTAAGRWNKIRNRVERIGA